MSENVQGASDDNGIGGLSLLEDCSNRVLLSVGGVPFETSLRTLRAVPDSNIAKSFSGNWRSFRNHKETILLDRRGDVRLLDRVSKEASPGYLPTVWMDMQLFGHVLEFLRSCRRGQEYSVPELAQHQLVLLQREAEVYGLKGLVELASRGVQSIINSCVSGRPGYG